MLLLDVLKFYESEEEIDKERGREYVCLNAILACSLEAKESKKWAFPASISYPAYFM